MNNINNTQNNVDESKAVNNIARLVIKEKKSLVKHSDEALQENAYARKIKHYSPASKEWSNSVYAYFKNTNKMYTSLDKTVSKLIKSYFNSYSNKLKKKIKKIRSRRVRVKEARLSTNRILVSKAELKHTNDKVMFTIYVYNNEKKSYLNKINDMLTINHMDRFLSKDRFLNYRALNYTAWNRNEKYNFIICNVNKLINQKWEVKDINNFKFSDLSKNIINNFLSDNYTKKIHMFFSRLFNKGLYLSRFPKRIRIKFKPKLKPEFKLEIRKKIKQRILLLRKRYLQRKKPQLENNIIKQVNMKVLDLKSILKDTKQSLNGDFSRSILSIHAHKYIQDFSSKILRREIVYTYFKQLVKFNDFKFEKGFISILSNEIKNIYSKDVEFNIVNLKYPYLDNSIFLTTLITKLKSRKFYYMNFLDKCLRMFKIKGLVKKDRQNIYDQIYRKKMIVQNLNINNFVPELYSNIESSINHYDPNIDVFERSLYNVIEDNKSSNNIKNPLSNLDKVVKSIRYKSLNGVRIELAGRLGRYNVASKSIYKLKYKGNIRNVDSSDKGLSTIMLRGNNKSNLQAGKLNSKIRIGSFGLKGWISGK